MTCPDFIVLQSGHWDPGDPDAWVFRIYCPGCGYDDVAECYDDAVTAREDHRRAVGANPKPKHRRRKVVEVEEFF